MTVGDDRGPAGTASLDGALGVAVGPSHVVYVADAGHARVRVIHPPLPGFALGDVLVPSKDGSVVYQFDETGKHLHTYDAMLGQTLATLSYDSDGLLASITDDAGNVTRFDRSQSGQVVVTAPFGQKTTLTLDATGYVTSLANPNAETVRFTYDEGDGGVENGLITKLTDPKGQVRSFQYGSDSLLTQLTDPAGGQKTLTRSNATGAGWTVTHKTKMGYTTSYAVSTPAAGGWERDVTGLTGAMSSYVEGEDGSRTTTVDDTNGKAVETRVVQLGPDPRYAMLAPVAARTTTTLLPSKLTMTMTDERTASVGASNFDLKSQTDVVTVNAGSAEPQVTTTVYAAGTSTSTRVVTTTTGRTATTTLDQDDRVIGFAVPGIAPQTFTYNTAPCPGGGEGCGGRLTQITATSPSDGTRTWTTHYKYSPDTGYASSSVDPVGNTTSWTRDLVGRVLRTQLPNLGGTTAEQNQVTQTYDKNGNLSTLTVPSASSSPPTHTFPSYTGVDELATYTPPPLSPALATASTAYQYDDDGQPTVTQVPDDSTYDSVKRTYDSSARLSTLADSKSGVTATWAYAPSGGPASITTSDGQTLDYGYGVDGPLVMSRTWSGLLAGSLTYTHDDFFRVSSRTVNGGAALDLLFDPDGYFIGTSGLATMSVTRDYDGKNGLITAATSTHTTALARSRPTLRATGATPSTVSSSRAATRTDASRH
jgi:YD repeat-containing protein